MKLFPLSFNYLLFKMFDWMMVHVYSYYVGKLNIMERMHCQNIYYLI